MARPIVYSIPMESCIVYQRLENAGVFCAGTLNQMLLAFKGARMAILKYESYSNCRISTGDDEFDSEHNEQLSISGKELIAAINAENVTDKIWARVLKNRSRAHQSLMDKIPGAS